MEIEQHNYKLKIEKLIEAGKLPTDIGVHRMDVLHDDWCAVFYGKACNCDPTIKVDGKEISE